jgi:hypothetical protein
MKMDITEIDLPKNRKILMGHRVMRTFRIFKKFRFLHRRKLDLHIQPRIAIDIGFLTVFLSGDINFLHPRVITIGSRDCSSSDVLLLMFREPDDAVITEFPHDQVIIVNARLYLSTPFLAAHRNLRADDDSIFGPYRCPASQPCRSLVHAKIRTCSAHSLHEFSVELIRANIPDQTGLRPHPFECSARCHSIRKILRPTVRTGSKSF